MCFLIERACQKHSATNRFTVSNDINSICIKTKEKEQIFSMKMQLVHLPCKYMYIVKVHSALIYRDASLGLSRFNQKIKRNQSGIIHFMEVHGYSFFS